MSEWVWSLTSHSTHFGDESFQAIDYAGTDNQTRTKQANFEKIACNVRPQPVTYLMEYAFTFTFASREFPPISVWFIVYDSINRPSDLDLWPFGL